MDKTTLKKKNRARRQVRIRSRVGGSAAKPRLSIFKSNRFLYAQLIDDTGGITLAAADSRGKAGANETERATVVGQTIAAAAKKAGITKVVFDRGGFRYQGVIAALAEAARAEGLAVSYTHLTLPTKRIV